MTFTHLACFEASTVPAKALRESSSPAVPGVGEGGEQPSNSLKPKATRDLWEAVRDEQQVTYERIPQGDARETPLSLNLKADGMMEWGSSRLHPANMWLWTNQMADN